MGVLGWASRRVIAAVIFAPLLGLWYIILSYATRNDPIAPERLAIAAIVLAGFTDWLIVRRIKRAMKEAKQQPR